MGKFPGEGKPHVESAAGCDAPVRSVSDAGVSTERARTPRDSARREAILATAARLLRQYGPAKTTMADIAREAHIGVGSLYLEFCSKDAIVEALSHDGHGKVLAAMRAAAGGDGGHGERLCAIFDARFEVFARLVAEGAHAGDLVHCNRSAVQRCHAEFMQAQRALLEAFLADAARAGTLAPDDARDAADALLEAYEGFAPPRLDASCPRNRSRLAALHRIVLAGLLPRDAKG